MIEYYKYNDNEIKDLMKSMVVLIDTREKKNDHIIEYFDKAGINYKKKKLDAGDYSFMIPANEDMHIFRDLYFDKEIMVERKGSLVELATNLSSERDRFEKELALAPKQKVVMIENSTYEDMVFGNYDSQYNNKSFWASIHSLWNKYNIPFIFLPDTKCSGVFIRGYLEYWLRNLIKN